MIKIILIILTFGTHSFAGIFSDGVKFFDEDISTKMEKKRTDIKDPTKQKFSWNEQLNIENDQFFKEGDYMPPAPLVEALRRPTKENILNFEKWQEMRNLLLQRYEVARSQYVAQTKTNIPKNEINETTSEEVELKKFRFIFYFESTCPSCHSMFQTINQMVQRGIYVEAIRVDKSERAVSGLNLPWNYANSEELKKLNLKAVPVLVAIEEESNRAYQMTGRKNIKEILQTIQRGLKKSN